MYIIGNSNPTLNNEYFACIMPDNNHFVVFDSSKQVIENGDYSGSIILKFKDNSIFFSDNLKIQNRNELSLKQGLMIGFDNISNKKIAFSKKTDFTMKKDFSTLEYAIVVPPEIMNEFDEGRFSETFPFTINLLHTTGLYFKDENHTINHIDFFKGEILKNPVSLIANGICLADRLVIDHKGDPVFYDCLIVGRDSGGELSVSYEPFVSVEIDNIENYIIILGNESLKEL